MGTRGVRYVAASALQEARRRDHAASTCRRLLKGFSGLAISAALAREMNDLDLQGEVGPDREWSCDKSCVRVDERRRQGTT
jgi:hypothetical protein